MTNEEFDNWTLNQPWELHRNVLGQTSIRTSKTRKHEWLGWKHVTLAEGCEHMEHIVYLHNQWYNSL